MAKLQAILTGKETTLNGQKISTLTASGNVQLEQKGENINIKSSEELDNAIKWRTNPNLLGNCYFAHPVNQRGKTSYSEKGYTIDRWCIQNPTGTAELVDGGIKLTKGSNSFFFQSFCELENVSDDTMLTFSILRADGTLESVTAKLTAGSGEKGAKKIPEGYIVIYRYSITFGGFIRVDTGSTTLLAAKLERGSVQTLAHMDSTGKYVLNHIPDYNDELTRCRYYYRVFDTEAQRTANNWGMRLANPTAGTIQIDGATKYTLDANL